MLTGRLCETDGGLAHDGKKKELRNVCEEESVRFQVPINTDHRLTAEQLFAPDEKKKRQATKKERDQRDEKRKQKSENWSRMMKMQTHSKFWRGEMKFKPNSFVLQHSKGIEGKIRLKYYT